MKYTIQPDELLPCSRYVVVCPDGDAALWQADAKVGLRADVHLQRRGHSGYRRTAFRNGRDNLFA